MGGLLLLVGASFVIVLLLIVLSGVRAIPNNRIGIVEKRFSGNGTDTQKK